jgi:hypothetical protein
MDENKEKTNEINKDSRVEEVADKITEVSMKVHEVLVGTDSALAMAALFEEVDRLVLSTDSEVYAMQVAEYMERSSTEFRRVYGASRIARADESRSEFSKAQERSRS